MTASEAIKWLKSIEKKYIHGGDEGFDNSRKVAILTAISALEKQIPKKLKETEAYPHRLYCPECYFTLAFNKDNADFIKSNQMYNFCPACGQKLLWESDTE